MGWGVGVLPLLPPNPGCRFAMGCSSRTRAGILLPACLLPHWTGVNQGARLLLSNLSRDWAPLGEVNAKGEGGGSSLQLLLRLDGSYEQPPRPIRIVRLSFLPPPQFPFAGLQALRSNKEAW